MWTLALLKRRHLLRWLFQMVSLGIMQLLLATWCTNSAKPSNRYSLFCANYRCAQNQPIGQAKYVVKLIPKQQQDKLLESLEPFADRIASDFEFTLLFDGNNSAFYLEDTPALQRYTENSLKLSAIKYDYADTVWQDKEKSYNVTGMPGQREKFFLMSYKEQPKWNITSEKKDIAGYTCYKATKVIQSVRGSKTFSKPIIAWFCPEISAPYGPLTYGNLPGLIFELQTEKYLYGIRNIQFNRNVRVPPKPQLEKAYTEDELIKSLRSSLGKE